LETILPKAKCHHYCIYRTYLEEANIPISDPSDEQSVVFRTPPEEEKAKITELVRTSHAIFYIPQGRGNNKMASVSRIEMFIYEEALKYHTRIYIMDQHGVYAPLIAQYGKRYGVDTAPILNKVQMFLPLYGIGTTIIGMEKKLGGCKSLATTTRAFIR
jgi:hypothetical protein